jgi:hypothetical protein
MEEYARRLGDGWYGGCESDSSVKGPLEDAGEADSQHNAVGLIVLGEPKALRSQVAAVCLTHPSKAHWRMQVRPTAS